ncbi:hypothetical protein V501_02775 [Pseudogymnoascus sp. VKM F-4519 (FW-2642)]|nr:hypothetical protein V501_02775 [Pseudogymnoascus sp. VKM F-4519 (FW-2642)]
MPNARQRQSTHHKPQFHHNFTATGANVLAYAHCTNLTVGLSTVFVTTSANHSVTGRIIICGTRKLNSAPKNGPAFDNGSRFTHPVKHSLRLEEGEVIPPARLAEDADLSAVRRDAAEVQTNNEEVEEDEFLPRLEEGEEARELVLSRQQVQVAQQHAPEEHGEECPVNDVHAVIDHAQLAPQARVLAAPREGEEAGVDDDRALEFHGDRPDVAVVVEERIPAAVEDEGEVLEVAVPLYQLVAVAALVLGVGPDAQRVPGCHVDEGRHDDRDVQAHPASKQRRGKVIPQLAILAALDQRERFRRQHVSRNDEEDRDSEVSPREERANERQTGEIILLLIPKPILENLIRPQRLVRPQLVMLPVHEKRRESAQPVEVGRPPELCLGLAPAGAREEGRAQVFGPVFGVAREGGELAGGVGGDPFLAQEAVVLEGHFLECFGGGWRRRGRRGDAGSRLEGDEVVRPLEQLMGN